MIAIQTYTATEIREAKSFEAAKEMVRANLQENDRWLVRGLLALYSRQTSDEQSGEYTRYDNKRGFNSTDAPLLTSFAKQVNRGRSLTAKQLSWTRKKMLKYSGQLARIAREQK